VSSTNPNLRRLLKRLRQHPTRPAGRILFTRAAVGPEVVLLLRGLLVLALFAFVFIVFYFERDGLKDALDGQVSGIDVVYFTMVTVTTVGYGDIVPVSDSARLVDALLVTPIRIFVWFIFVGTAYQLVIQRVIEDWRMQHLQRRLSGHIVICGFGNSGKSAAAELLGKGMAPQDIVVIDSNDNEVAAAVEQGFVGLLGEATREELQRVAAVERARGIVVAVARDDTSLMIVVTARGLGSTARIVVSVHERENIKLLRNAGADTVVTPWSFSGYLLADGVTQLYTVDLMQDALSHGGELSMNERAPTAAEVGRLARELRYSLVLGIVRNGRRLMFWEDSQLRIEPQDQLIVMDARQGGES
jgi:voltage-gated potassium channel